MGARDAAEAIRLHFNGVLRDGSFERLSLEMQIVMLANVLEL